MNKKLVFSHIPKTAGTSLTYLLKVNFGWNLLPVLFRPGSGANAYVKENLEKDLLWYPNCKCLTGHSLKPFIDFGEHEHEMIWFTFLRDPVKRYISHYVHQQEGGDPNYVMSLEKWAAKYNRNNWMVRMIAGEENLEMAIEILNRKIQFVGLTEKFDESLKMMVALLGLKQFDIDYGQPKMQSKNQDLKEHIYSEIDQYQDLLTTQNILDIQLYDYVKKNVWPVQVEAYQNYEKTHFEVSKFVKKINLLKYKVKNNLIYKPFVNLQHK